MITEVTVLQLQADCDLQNPESLLCKDFRDKLSRKLHGEHASFAYYGQSIEQPKTAFTFVGLDAWDGEKHDAGSL